MSGAQWGLFISQHSSFHQSGKMSLPELWLLCQDRGSVLTEPELLWHSSMLSRLTIIFISCLNSNKKSLMRWMIYTSVWIEILDSCDKVRPMVFSTAKEGFDVISYYCIECYVFVVGSSAARSSES